MFPAVFPDMCISGGLSQPFFTTEQDCQSACIVDPGCEGIDFDQNSGSCFFHSSGTECGVLTPQTGCIHYRYVDCGKAFDLLDVYAKDIFTVVMHLICWLYTLQICGLW